jgi:two-component system, LytTR family, response regulator
VIRALIVGDEPLARARLRRLLGAEPDVEVVGECPDGSSALAALAAGPVDLLVLDVQMPERDGFEVAGAIGGGLPVTMFVTAYEEHARRAFDADAVDYLLKPVDPDRLTEALARARRRIELERKISSYPRRIPARSGNRVKFVDAEEIDWIEAQGNYAALHTAAGSELVRETMTALEQRLDPRRFARIHRRHIVRIDRIEELEPHSTGEYVVVLRGGTRLISGRTYRTRLAALARGGWPSQEWKP